MEETKGFRVVIEDVKGLFKQLNIQNEVVIDERGNPQRDAYELAKSPMIKYVSELSIWGQSNEKEFRLGAIMTPTYKKEQAMSHYHLDFDHDHLAGLFSTKQVGRVLFIVDAAGKSEYSLRSDAYTGRILINGKGDSQDFQTPGKKISDLESFRTQLERFASIVEAVVSATYSYFKNPAPDIEVVMRPLFFEASGESKADLFAQMTGLDKITKLMGGGDQKERIAKAIKVEKPSTTFADIGGQKQAKEEIQGISFALSNPGLYKKWGTRPPKGVLLFGDPGTGKTLLPKALANETGANFYHVKLSDILSMWYGESEKLMQAVFDVATENTPCIVFIDEIDALATHRDTADEASQRVLATLLENIDGLETVAGIILIASTNRPNAIDPALKRAGRLDILIEVGLPKDDADRMAILAIHIAKAEAIAGRKLFALTAGHSLELAAKTTGKTGADIAELVRRTLEKKVRLEARGETPNLATIDEILAEIAGYERMKDAAKKIGF